MLDKRYCKSCRLVSHSPKDDKHDCGSIFENYIPTCAFCGKPADVRRRRKRGTIEDFWCFKCNDKLLESGD